MVRFLTAASATLALSLGATASADPLHEVQQPVVYGDDNRTEVALHPDAALRTLADESIVTLLSRPAVDFTGSAFRIGGATLGASQGLCEGERFAEQPAAGFCSGTLVGEDIVLTAGHCIGGESACRGTVLAFNYQWNNGLETIGVDDLYNCREVIARAESENPTRDYALLRLDRPVVGHAPANLVDARGALRVGEGFTIIGSPSGIPQKIDDGGSVRDTGDGSVFVGTPDSFGGNSGSGIFADGSLDLIGILISGEQDYAPDGTCNRVNVCSETGCQGENMLYSGLALDALCNLKPGAAACGASVCGDDICTPDERGTCSDCDVDAVCGNQWCEGDEWSSCPDDCVIQVPAGWTCEPSYYGTQDGCDCNCGAYDPDCDDGNQEVLNCGFGSVCNIDGTCAAGGDSAFCDVSTTAAGSRMRLLALLCALGAVWVVRRRVRA